MSFNRYGARKVVPRGSFLLARQRDLKGNFLLSFRRNRTKSTSLYIAWLNYTEDNGICRKKFDQFGNYEQNDQVFLYI